MLCCLTNCRIIIIINYTILYYIELDPSAAEFSRRHRKIWSRRKSAEKKFGWPKIRQKNKIRPPPNFLRPIFGGGAKKRNYGV